MLTFFARQSRGLSVRVCSICRFSRTVRHLSDWDAIFEDVSNQPPRKIAPNNRLSSYLPNDDAGDDEGEEYDFDPGDMDLSPLDMDMDLGSFDDFAPPQSAHWENEVVQPPNMFSRPPPARPQPQIYSNSPATNGPPAADRVRNSQLDDTIVNVPSETKEGRERSNRARPSSPSQPVASPITAAFSDEAPSPVPFDAPPDKMTPNDNDIEVVEVSRIRQEVQWPDDRRYMLTKTTNGDFQDMTIEKLQFRLEDLAQKIYQRNNGVAFNINSSKQVSTVLFGTPDQSTNKDALEAMGGAGNVMADLIIQYRTQKAEIKRQERKAKSITDGKQVSSISKTIPMSTKSQAIENNSIKRARTLAEKKSLGDDNDPLILVDASAYIWRAYYSMPPIHRSDGMPTGAVMGFCNMLNKLVLNRLLQGECPRMVLVFDAKGKNFRHELYRDYKANRADCPIDLVPQFDLIHELAKAYGIPEVEANGYEADDVIATLATSALQEGIDTHILSGDKDLMQLVTPPDTSPYIHMVDPMAMVRIDHDVVFEKWGVTPDLVGDILALSGDSADNIPGVKGIGPKIAADLLNDFGSLAALLDQLDKVKQKGRREKLQEHKELAVLSRQLVELERFIPMDSMKSVPVLLPNVDSLRMAPFDYNRLMKFYNAMGFRKLKQQVTDRMTLGTGTDNALSGSRSLSGKPKSKSKATAWNNSRPKVTVPVPEDYEDVPF